MSSARLTKMNNPNITNTQKWFRNHAKLLGISFQSSGLIEQKVTKGESREFQILDTLSNFLPNRICVESNVLIVNSNDDQSPKFDGALLDLTFWPRLLAENNITIAMIESVLAAIEVKSSLAKSDLKDIFSKSSALKIMAFESGLKNRKIPLVTAFAYKCANPNLSFFDFATLFSSAPMESPSLICILNQNLFGLAKNNGSKIIPVDEPQSDAMPILFITKKDTLLTYIYFLCRWITLGTEISSFFALYSNNFFSKVKAFHFDKDFLDTIKLDNSAYKLARRCFFGQAKSDINDLYKNARKILNMS